MTTQPKKMNIIKQVLTGHKNGLSVREMAGMFSMNPTTVQRYLKMAGEDSLGINALLQLEDPELNHRFNGGNPAYCDKRFEDFKKRLPHFEQELKKPHMTAYFLWEEYRKDVPDGYGLIQFRFHLKQNTVAVKCKCTRLPIFPVRYQSFFVSEQQVCTLCLSTFPRPWNLVRIQFH